MSEMTKYTSRGGTEVALSTDMVYHLIGKGNDKLDHHDLTCYIALCKELKLNPFVPGEVHLVKYDSSKPAQIVVGKQSFNRIADENPNYIKRESGVTILNKDGELQHRVGSAVYPVLKETLLGGWCDVYYRRDQSKEIECRQHRVALQEYNTNKSLWKDKTGTMIEKVAVVQCLRETFPNDYKGAYSEEEMSVHGEFTQGNHEVVNQQKTEPVITQKQRKELFDHAEKVYGTKMMNELLMATIQKFGHSSTHNLPESELVKIMDYITNNPPQMPEEEQYIDLEPAEYQESQEYHG